jgi:prepilin-type N-terminal cleavage/methylation domain-containing protein
LLHRVPKEEAGFSLVEVMVSIMLLSIAIIPMVGMFDMGLNSASKAGNYDGGRALANSNLQKVMALPYSTATDPAHYRPVNASTTPGTTVSCDTGIYTCGVTTHYVNDSFVDNSASTTKMRVEVIVSWAGGSYTTTGLKAQ